MTQKTLEELKGKSIRFFTKIKGVSSKVEGKVDSMEVFAKTKEGTSKKVNVLVIKDAVINNSSFKQEIRFSYKETMHISSFIIKGDYNDKNK